MNSRNSLQKQQQKQNIFALMCWNRSLLRSAFELPGESVSKALGVGEVTAVIQVQEVCGVVFKVCQR